MNPVRITLFLVCMLAVPVATPARTSRDDLRKADWSVSAPHNLAENPPANDAVWKFIGLLPGRITFGKLCEFHFVDLRRNGTLSLVANDDGGGTVDCNIVEVFDKSGGSIEEYELPGYPEIEDINGDGHFELVVDDTVASEGSNDRDGMYSHCEACRACSEIWPRVYAWTGMGYSEVSSQYPKYYERELGSLKKQIAAINAAEAAAKLPTSAVPTPVQSAPRVFTHGSFSMSQEQRTGMNQQGQTLSPSVAVLRATEAVASPAPEAVETPDPGELDCLKAEAAKMERFLGTAKDAGMADAIRWANSNNPGERDFATNVLRDIGTVEALKYEQTLAHDSEHDVAASAKEELKEWGKPETPDAFERAPQLR